MRVLLSSCVLCAALASELSPVPTTVDAAIKPEAVIVDDNVQPADVPVNSWWGYFYNTADQATLNTGQTTDATSEVTVAPVLIDREEHEVADLKVAFASDDIDITSTNDVSADFKEVSIAQKDEEELTALKDADQVGDADLSEIEDVKEAVPAVGWYGWFFGADEPTTPLPSAVKLDFTDQFRAGNVCRDTYKTDKDCDTDSSCTWCESHAVQSFCVSKDMAARLPAGVFTCGDSVFAREMVPAANAYVKSQSEQAPKQDKDLKATQEELEQLTFLSKLKERSIQAQNNRDRIRDSVLRQHELSEAKRAAAVEARKSPKEFLKRNRLAALTARNNREALSDATAAGRHASRVNQKIAAENRARLTKRDNFQLKIRRRKSQAALRRERMARIQEISEQFALAEATAKSKYASPTQSFDVSRSEVPHPDYRVPMGIPMDLDVYSSYDTEEDDTEEEPDFPPLPNSSDTSVRQGHNDSRQGGYSYASVTKRQKLNNNGKKYLTEEF